jgi:hypothetical protein
MIFPRITGKTIFIILFFLFFSIKSIFAQEVKIKDENYLINCFFKSLYNFSFREADSIVNVMSKTSIGNATISNIKANLAWWKLLSGDSINTNIKNCNSNVDESIRLLSLDKKQDVLSLMNMIYSYSLKARLENYRGNTLKSLINFYKSVDYIEKCIDLPDKDEKLYLVVGLYLYFVDYIENEHFLVSALFFSFPKGDKTKGLKYLEDCSASNNEMIRTEANYFLMKIYTNTEKDYSKAYLKAQILTQLHPKNLVYSLEQLKLLLVLKNSGEAQVFQNNLIEEIHDAENINSIQKNHFILQIQEITKTGNKI